MRTPTISAHGIRPTLESPDFRDSGDSQDESVDGAGLRLTRCGVLGNIGEGARSTERPDCGHHSKHRVHATNAMKLVCHGSDGGVTRWSPSRERSLNA